MYFATKVQRGQMNGLVLTEKVPEIDGGRKPRCLELKMELEKVL